MYLFVPPQYWFFSSLSCLSASGESVAAQTVAGQDCGEDQEQSAQAGHTIPSQRAARVSILLHTHQQRNKRGGGGGCMYGGHCCILKYSLIM